MQNSMIIRADRPNMLNRYHDCPQCICSACTDAELPVDSVIPEFYGEQTAKDAGWIKTNDPVFCPSSKKFVWVCPDCIEADGRKWVQK